MELANGGLTEMRLWSSRAIQLTHENKTFLKMFSALVIFLYGTSHTNGVNGYEEEVNSTAVYVGGLMYIWSLTYLMSFLAMHANTTTADRMQAAAEEAME